jgi:hypothetical protein
MTDERSFQEMLEYRLAILKIESAFETCNQFGKANKKASYEEIRHQLSQHSLNGHADAQPRFSDRCFELADMAPTDEIRRFLLSVVDFCYANLDIEDNVTVLRKRAG